MNIVEALYWNIKDKELEGIQRDLFLKSVDRGQKAYDASKELNKDSGALDVALFFAHLWDTKGAAQEFLAVSRQRAEIKFALDAFKIAQSKKPFRRRRKGISAS